MAKRASGKFAVGSDVAFAFGGRRVVAKVIEDRGHLGVGGRRLLRVRVDGSGGADPIVLEIPAEQVTTVPARVHSHAS